MENNILYRFLSLIGKVKKDLWGVSSYIRSLKGFKNCDVVTSIEHDKTCHPIVVLTIFSDLQHPIEDDLHCLVLSFSISPNLLGSYHTECEISWFRNKNLDGTIEFFEKEYRSVEGLLNEFYSLSNKFLGYYELVIDDYVQSGLNPKPPKEWTFPE